MAVQCERIGSRKFKFSKDFDSYNNHIEFTRKNEFARLKDMIYLDHAGATLYAQSQISGYCYDLCHQVYGNPHSGSESSQLTSEIIEQIRYRVLDHFHTHPEEYSVIFTSNCTHALKILADTFQFRADLSVDNNDDSCNKSQESHSSRDPSNSSKATVSECPEVKGMSAFQDKTNPSNPVMVKGQTTIDISKPMHEDEITESRPDHDSDILDCSCVAHNTGGYFCYLEDNHTSVIGMREVIKQRGVRTLCVSPSEACDVLGNGLPAHARLTKYLTSNLTDSISQPSHRGNLSFRKLLSGSTDPETRYRCLFAYPAQSNFSGTRYPLTWISRIQNRHLQKSHGLSGSGTEAGSRRWYVLLDAASFVTTSQLDLSSYQPDFVAISFYKMFGFPTGLGALLVRNVSGHVLDKHYFGGGTVKVVLPTEDYHRKKDNISDRFEDGTVPFLEILALRHGFDALCKLTGDIQSITSHTFQLASFVYHTLATGYHSNGQPIAELYCDTEFESSQVQGPIVNFNLLKPSGEYYGYMQVEKLAHVYGIQLRTGCFCNTGACQRLLVIDTQTVKDNYKAGHVCGDGMDLIDGKPTGSVRLSVGYMSTLHDVQIFLRFVHECFVDNPRPNMPDDDEDDEVFYDASEELQPDVDFGVGGSDGERAAVGASSEGRTGVVGRRQGVPAGENTAIDSANHSHHVTALTDFGTRGRRPQQETVARDATALAITASIADDLITERKPHSSEEAAPPNDITLTHIFLYPVKSCGAFQVTEWPIGPRGLLYDREWMIVTETGVCLTQKREPLMCLIRPLVDLDRGLLRLTFPGSDDICVTLDTDRESITQQASLCQSKVCADRVKGVDCGHDVAIWLQTVLGREGLRLIRQTQPRIEQAGRSRGTSDQSELSLANEAQFLLINESSVAEVCQRINESEKSDNTILDVACAIRRFRANLVISAREPFVEEQWNTLTIGTHLFQCVQTCSRCQMICIDQDTGIKSSEPLRTLIKMRNKKVHFGVLMTHVSGEGSKKLKIGQRLLTETA